MRGRGDHRLGRGLMIAAGVAATVFFGALLFERPAGERVEKAFRKADPGAELVIVERGPRDYRTVLHTRRSGWRTREEVATVLWCARDLRRPDRRMAIEYHNSPMPLASGPKTVAKSWVIGRGITADNILAECAREPRLPEPRQPGSPPVPVVLGP